MTIKKVYSARCKTKGAVGAVTGNASILKMKISFFYIFGADIFPIV
jgi:hypothetical protein